MSSPRPEHSIPVLSAMETTFTIGDASPTPKSLGVMNASGLEKQEVHSSVYSPRAYSAPTIIQHAHADDRKSLTQAEFSGQNVPLKTDAKTAKSWEQKWASFTSGERLSIVLGRRVRRRARERGRYPEVNKERLLERLRLEHTMVVDLTRLIIFFIIFVLLNFVGEVDKHSIERRAIGR